VPLKHAGLALAIGLGACINASLLLRGLRRREIYKPQPGWPQFLLKLAGALYAMSVVLWVAMPGDTAWLAMAAVARAWNLAWIVLLGAGTYFAALWLFGFRLRDFSKRAAD
jgi:putative peptidoglycan lipid II flippase